MNAHTDIVAAPALALAATNADILRAIRDGFHLAPGDVGHACGRPTKNMARDIGVLVREGLVHKEDADHYYELTDTGRAALQGVDLAQGRADPPPAAEPANDVLMLRHDQIRPNPLNPRKAPPDREKLDGLKASIVAARDVLQNLTVFPADADGVHVLAAGERRWLAVGELIAEGVWPSEQRLRAVMRENTPGQAAFVGLVENGQRDGLNRMDEARAYASLCEETGWSARHAALQTGRDPKTVQQMLQVVRLATPETIARYEDPKDGYTWEDLRRSVQQSQELAPEAGLAQADVEELTLPYVVDDHARRNLAYHSANCGKLKPKARLILVELADKVLRDPFPGQPLSTRGADDTGDANPDVIMAGVGISWDGAGSIVRIAASSLEWLRGQGLLTATGDRAAVLRRARKEAGISVDRMDAAEEAGAYITAWLNPPYAPQQKAASHTPIIGGAGSVQPPKPLKEAAGPDTDLTSIQKLAVVELAHRLWTQDDGAEWAKVGKYWLDQASTELRDLGFVVFSHGLPGGPHAGIPNAGRAWVLAHYPKQIGPIDLDTVRCECGVTRQLEPGVYVTPWLNVDASAARAEAAEPKAFDHTGGVSDERAAETDAEDADDDDLLDALVGDLRDRFAASRDQPERWNRLSATGLAGAAVAAISNGQTLAAVEALAGLLLRKGGAEADVILRDVVFGSGLDRTPERDTSDDDPLLFALRSGDVVSIGGAASGYRLLRTTERMSGAYPVETPQFESQQVSLKTGKNVGKPRAVTLHAIQGVVAAAALRGIAKA